ncbi:hypothetical protein Tco_0935045, partial [Tanacetum coccineum]
MKRERNSGIWDFEHGMQSEGGGQDLILGLDGGTTSTVCICMPIFDLDDDGVPPDPPPVLARAIAGCSNHNSVGGNSSALLSLRFPYLWLLLCLKFQTSTL